MSGGISQGTRDPVEPAISGGRVALHGRFGGAFPPAEPEPLRSVLIPKVQRNKKTVRFLPGRTVSLFSKRYPIFSAAAAGQYRNRAPDQPFKWQGSYGAFSISLDHLDPLGRYIARQREHHALGTVVTAWEEWDDG